MSILASNFIFDNSKLTRFQPRVYVGMNVRIDIWIDSNKNLHWIFRIWKAFEGLDQVMKLVKKIENLEIWKNEGCHEFLIFQINIYKSFIFFKFSSSKVRIFLNFEIFRILSFFQIFKFRFKIWILSRLSPESNLFLIWTRQNPDLSLD